MEKKVYSPQEERIQNEINHKEIVAQRNNRANSILQNIRNQKPKIDIERAYYFTESFKETEGQPLILRWAKALYRYAQKATVYIDDKQLLVGRSGKSGRYGILYPELDGNIFREAIRKLPTRENSPFDIDEKDAQIIADEIAPYWEERTFHEDLSKALTEETRKLTYNNDKEHTSRYIVNETASFRSSLQWVHDYEIVMQKGFKGIKEEAEERLGQLDEYSPVDNREKRPFLEAEIITCDAIVLWANRHAELAKKFTPSSYLVRRYRYLRKCFSFCCGSFSDGRFAFSFHHDRWHLSVNRYSSLLAEGTVFHPCLSV